jgi:hypothetical protein
MIAAMIVGVVVWVIVPSLFAVSILHAILAAPAEMGRRKAHREHLLGAISTLDIDEADKETLKTKC